MRGFHAQTEMEELVQMDVSIAITNHSTLAIVKPPNQLPNNCQKGKRFSNISTHICGILLIFSLSPTPMLPFRH